MKKYFKIFILFLLINLFFISSIHVFAENVNLNICSNSALLMDANSGKILYEKNINEKIYPASITKIMTAILVIENCSLTDTIIVSPSAVNNVSFGYVTANLKAGETFTVEQMLYCLMIASANDAAFVLSEYVSGSSDSFVELMNLKAIEIGCQNTHFVNPNGIHDDNHYSTAYDIALISKYAMENETFRDIVTHSSYKLPTTEFYLNDDRIFATTNEMLIPYSNYYYKYSTGIKTGYTSVAGYCLVASAENNGLSLITVVIGGKKDSERYIDTKALFEYGYENYSMQRIAEKNTAVQTVKIKNATFDTKNLNALLKDNIYAIVKNDSNEVIFPEITFYNKLKAPINKDDTIGTVTYNIGGISYSTDLIASNSVRKSYLLLYILIFILSVWILLRFFKLLKKNKNSRKKK